MSTMNHHGLVGQGHNINSNFNNGNGNGNAASASASTTLTLLKDHLSAYSQTLKLRCQRNHGWTDSNFVDRVFDAYCQFLELKVMLQDFDATILSQPGYVDVMWHEHILDTKNYLECCGGLGNVIHHNPDGGLDVPARMTRIRNTEIALKSRFPNHEIDPIIWELPTNPTTSTSAPTTTSTAMITTMTASNPTTAMTAWAPSSSTTTTTTTASILRSSKRSRLQARMPIPPQTATANTNVFFHVFVKSLTGKTITIRIHKRTTMLQLTHIIQDVEGIPPDQQRLIYQGKEISSYPNMTADMVHLREECTIHLISKLSGC